jgi:hypothetical protein
MAKKNKELEKHEKEVKKKAKEAFFAEEIKKEKADARRVAASSNKKAIDKEHTDKMRQMGRELEKRMGGYGVGPMPNKNAEEDSSPIRRAPVAEDENADLEEPSNDVNTLSPKKTPALGRAALNKSQSAMKLNSLMNASILEKDLAAH